MSDMDAYKDIFLSESTEFMQGITNGLLELEATPEDLAPVEVIFRGAHSLKGMAAAMGYRKTADLTHKMESLMDRVRQHERAVDRGLIDLLLEAVDAVRDLIDAESSGADDCDVGDLTDRIVRAAEGEPAGAAGACAPSDLQQSNIAMEGGAPAVGGDIPVSSDGAPCFSVVCRLDEGCVLKAVRAYMVIKRLAHMGTVIDTIPSGREIEDEEFDREFTVVLESSAEEDHIKNAVLAVSEVDSCHVETTSMAQPAPVVEEEAQQAPAPVVAKRMAIPKLSETQTVRIAIGHLDTMMNLVGELVILRSRLDRIAADLGDRELDETCEEIHRVAVDLQQEVMHTRMVPVGNIFNRFPRMVRDLAHDLDKEIAFELDGLEIELDRTVLDEIGDPIVHLLRNGVDHGIELPAERETLGKPKAGRLRLAAFRERDRVKIVVSDDGRGIDCERVWAKACTLGIVDSANRSTYLESDVLELTCAPGFSTAEKATKVSGRGVGMDVVKGKIEHLGGTLTISSTPGVGSEFVLTLPLTLAIIQGLLVKEGLQTYVIPLSAVEEVVGPDDLALDSVDGHTVVLDREGEVVPLYKLDALVGVADEMTCAPRPDENIVLLESAGQRRALIVSTLLGRHEIVIKPLSRMFSGTKGIGGATVLGDGTVALIVDPRSIFPGREETA